ncbi:MAG: alpha-L-fucosidase [Ginsengibacter sp.]
MKKILLSIIVWVCSVYILQAQSNTSSADSIRMQWWKDAKFGMFIHWGVYSVPAGRYEGKTYPGIGEWIMNHAKIPSATYKLYARQFNPVKYNPEAWVKMAKDAGMKYIVITSKHHDGFAMFDSKVTDWDIVDATPYGKDALKPLVEACRREGIRIGFYYSQAQDWNHPGGSAYGEHWDKAQDGDMDAYLDTIAVPQVKEILSNYGEMDILWWDTPKDMTQARAEKFLPILKEHPNLITNNRLGGGYKGDTETPEQFVPSTGFPGRNWEACMTMNDTWGFKSDDQNWKSTKTLIRNLAEIVSKGGNFLLNVGPTSLGEIPQPSIERLTEVGKWLDVNQESIYGTTASMFPYLSYGRSTRKGQKLYLHVFNYPGNKLLGVPMANKISKAYLLADPSKSLLVTKGKTNKNSVIHLPAQAPDTINTVVAVEFEGEPVISRPPMEGKAIVVSSESENEGSKNLTDGNRLTRWVAAKGQRKASAEVDLKKPVPISTLIVDEPWHPWDNKKQHLTLQYKSGAEWKTILDATTKGIGDIQSFKPVTAQYFRLMIENEVEEPVLLEWQIFGPE